MDGTGQSRGRGVKTMQSALTETEVKPGGGSFGPTRHDSWAFGGGGGGEGRLGVDTAQIGLWVLLGSLTMLFAAFTSAYLVRRTASDWVRIEILPLLWLNTSVLLSSSATIEWARRSFRSWKIRAFRRWIGATFVLGGLFLAGQFLAWRELADAGIYIGSNPHSSFFYVLTGVHAAHLIAGVGALLYVLAQSWRGRLIPGESSAPELTATYWHFVGVVWVYLFCVLFLL